MLFRLFTHKSSTHMCRPDEKLKLTFMTNAVGPIIAYKYFKSLLDKGETKMIVNFASNYGSLTLASEPLKDSSKATPLDHTQIAYKASKAAVNMGMFADGFLQLRSACLHTPSGHHCSTLARIVDFAYLCLTLYIHEIRNAGKYLQQMLSHACTIYLTRTYRRQCLMLGSVHPLYSDVL